MFVDPPKEMFNNYNMSPSSAVCVCSPDTVHSDKCSAAGKCLRSLYAGNVLVRFAAKVWSGMGGGASVQQGGNVKQPLALKAVPL